MGAAMDVPLMLPSSTLQLLLLLLLLLPPPLPLPLPSLTPSPCAESTSLPGASTSGLRRPSAHGPNDEYGARVPARAPLSVAPTAIAFFAVAGSPTVPAPPPSVAPSLPAATTTRKSGCSHLQQQVEK